MKKKQAMKTIVRDGSDDTFEPRIQSSTPIFIESLWSQKFINWSRVYVPCIRRVYYLYTPLPPIVTVNPIWFFQFTSLPLCLSAILAKWRSLAAMGICNLFPNDKSSSTYAGVSSFCAINQWTETRPYVDTCNWVHSESLDSTSGQRVLFNLCSKLSTRSLRLNYISNDMYLFAMMLLLWWQ